MNTATYDFRTLGTQIVPPWISRGPDDTSDGARAYYGMLTMLDHQTERARQGLLCRFPDFTPDDGVALLCKDRGIIRGFEEPREAINARLKAWWDTWKKAGSAFGLLDELAGYLSPYEVRLRTVDNSGNWYAREPDGTKSYSWDQANWDWDSATNGSHAAQWSRFWVIIYPLASGLWPLNPDLGDANLWGGDLSGSVNVTIGSTATPEQAATVRRIVQLRKPAGTRCVQIIVAYDDASFDPAAPEPDGAWANQGKVVGGVYVPARLGSARYWRGTAP